MVWVKVLENFLGWLEFTLELMVDCILLEIGSI